MTAAGFMKDMINSAKGNRSLLKGNDASAYKSFDAQSYRATATKAPKFKACSKEVILSIRDQVLAENNQAQKTKKLFMVLSVSLIGILAIILFTLKF